MQTSVVDQTKSNIDLIRVFIHSKGNMNVCAKFCANLLKDDNIVHSTRTVTLQLNPPLSNAVDTQEQKYIQYFPKRHKRKGQWMKS